MSVIRKTLNQRGIRFNPINILDDPGNLLN